MSNIRSDFNYSALLGAVQETKQVLALRDGVQDARKMQGWISYENSKTEVKSLTAKFNELQFSEPYRRWTNKSRDKLISSLKSIDSFPKSQKDWDGLSLEEKKDAVKQFVKLTYNVFSDNPFNFKARRPYVRYFSEGFAPGKTFLAGGFASSSKLDWLCRINMNTHSDAGFDKFYSVLNMVFHESMHVFHHSFADIYQAGLCPKGHPLEGDMQMLSFGHSIGYGVMNYIKPLYHAQPRERDSYWQAKQFVREFQNAFHKPLNVNDNMKHQSILQA